MVGVPSVLIGIITAFFLFRRLCKWWRPMRLSPATRHVFDGSGPDQVLATITNVSDEDQVLIRCRVRSAHPIRASLLKHIRRPLTPPRLYPTIWFGAICLDLMGKEPIRLAPKEQRRLSYSLSGHPLCQFVTPEMLIEAQTSEGRIFRSRRIGVPKWWRTG